MSDLSQLNAMFEMMTGMSILEVAEATAAGVSEESLSLRVDLHVRSQQRDVLREAVEEMTAQPQRTCISGRASMKKAAKFKVGDVVMDTMSEERFIVAVVHYDPSDGWEYGPEGRQKVRTLTFEKDLELIR